MKRLLALLISMLMVLGIAAGCGTEESGGGDADVKDPKKEDLRIWSFTDEIPNAIKRYQELFPDSVVNKFNIDATIVSDQEGAYEQAIQPAMLAGGDSAPDLFMAEQAFVLKFVSGSFSGYAATYHDLGIVDVEGKIKAAELAQYAVDAGRDENGDIVGLRFQETGCALIYRRSIAIDTWGTDDPAEIKKIVSSNGWDSFLAAAEDLKEKGYAIVLGDEDIWQVARDGAAQSWVTADNKLYIDPAREFYFDLAKTMEDNNYFIGGGAWSEGWNSGMAGATDPQVFSYLGPAWLINYVMVNNVGDTFGDWAVAESPVPWAWGGTWLFGHKDLEGEKKEAIAEIIEWITLDTSNTSFQHYFANGNLYEGSKKFKEKAEEYAKGEFTKDTVASAVVMARSNGEIALLGDQNMFDVYIPAAAGAKSSHWHEFDRTINSIFMEECREYYSGNKTKEQAIADFKTRVNEQLDIGID